MGRQSYGSPISCVWVYEPHIKDRVPVPIEPLKPRTARVVCPLEFQYGTGVG